MTERERRDASGLTPRTAVERYLRRRLPDAAEGMDLGLEIPSQAVRRVVRIRGEQSRRRLRWLGHRRVLRTPLGEKRARTLIDGSSGGQAA